MRFAWTFPFAVICTIASASHAQVQESEIAAQILDRSPYAGTLLVYREGDAYYQAGHSELVTKALIPASTFKIVSAMIALDTGVVPDAHTVLAWDGVTRSRAEINKDLDLISAFRVSALPHFQALVRQIGPDTMQQYIDAFGYGNQDIGGGDDSFWISGNVRITPIEQIELLRRLYNDDLPVRQEVMSAVKNMMISEETDHYVIRSKTGLAVLEGEHYVGWWVGWVERGNERIFFASALEADSPGDDFIPARIALMREFLQTFGVLTN